MMRSRARARLIARRAFLTAPPPGAVRLIVRPPALSAPPSRA
jgi:hypothetical protein